MNVPNIAPHIAKRAVHWWVELQSGNTRDTDRRAFEHWLAEHPDHARAWRHIESVSGRMRGLSEHASAARAALAQKPARRRRESIKLLMLLFFAGGSAYVAEQRLPWRAWKADYRTAVGERRTITLADGTRLMLNTDSAIDIRYTADARRVRLVRGEIMVTTGHAEPSSRRFFVDTTQATLEALGTRFAVRQDADNARLDVFEGAVRIEPMDAPQNAAVLHAGERARFDRLQVARVQRTDPDDAAWTSGLIVASHMRLDDFLAELSRYRNGLVRCDPDIAALRLSGTYPLDDTDRVLAALAHALPVRVEYVTRYWVAVRPT
ncbi:FecR domain-containing protein [Caballeronia sp. BR00000012568055]|uniref:FecR domain-containing protein n=1 Tax=Caballeronia sp. BR00000012568055 TaxID=2918761 RepID=UPI0023F8831E|nr:FecR domain-containing protein [Caballeronia sp. BR00000012568055]